MFHKRCTFVFLLHFTLTKYRSIMERYFTTVSFMVPHEHDISLLLMYKKISCRSLTMLPHFKPFTTYRRFLTPLQQRTFENIMTKAEISHNEQFLLLPQCFNFLFRNYFQRISISGVDGFNVVCYRCVVCGKGLNHAQLSTF